MPAHLYRTLLVRENVYLWDNLWFAGHYPLVSYSLLYYPVAAVVGNVTLVLGSVVASADALRARLRRASGARRPSGPRAPSPCSPAARSTRARTATQPARDAARDDLGAAERLDVLAVGSPP